MALECTFKVLSDELDEDEDLHNKLKCDQITSDEEIAADYAKISTLETSISGESVRVAQLTEEIDTLEKDLLAKSEISEFSRCERDLRETEDIENSVLSQLKASFLSFQGTPDTSSWTFQEQKCSEPRDECVVIFREVPRNQRVFPAACQSEW